jgi:predicted GNAT family acetyltransferase
VTQTTPALRVETLSDANRAAALAFLARSPYEHVFLTYVASGSPLERDVRVALGDRGATGVALIGDHVVLGSDDGALPAFAALAAPHRERAIVGPRRTVRAYWQIVAPLHRPPRLVRERQPLMAVDRATLQTPPPADVRVRHAREDEWEIVARNSAAMISGEIDADARGDLPDFGLGIRRMIRMGLWWVGERRGELCFFCNVGAWSERTAQLQGIWTPPEMRARGYAGAALGAICSTLLCMVPTLSLYVNEFNVPARALYERLGFRQVGELQTLFF